MPRHSEGRPASRPTTKRTIRRNRTTLLRLVVADKPSFWDYDPDERLCNLRTAAARLYEGREVDPLWLRIQLLDLIDLLAARRVG